MPRKKQPSGLQVLLGAATIIPWFVSLTLAAISFGLLHWYAGIRVELPDLSHNPTGGFAYVLDNAKHGAAKIFQYLIPAIFSFLALGSMLGRRVAAQLHDKVASDPAPNALEKVTWREFEQLVAETFRRQGYEVTLRGGDGPDGGVDVELHMGKDRYLVQCKQWKTRQVGVAIVRELYGVMSAEGAVGGFVVASGTFTPDAGAFAKGKSIELVDARSLRHLMGGHTATKRVRAAVAVPATATPAGGSHTGAHTARGDDAGCNSRGAGHRAGASMPRVWHYDGTPDLPQGAEGGNAILGVPGLSEVQGDSQQAVGGTFRVPAALYRVSKPT